MMMFAGNQSDNSTTSIKLPDEEGVQTNKVVAVLMPIGVGVIAVGYWCCKRLVCRVPREPPTLSTAPTYDVI